MEFKVVKRVSTKSKGVVNIYGITDTGSEIALHLENVPNSYVKAFSVWDNLVLDPLTTVSVLALVQKAMRTVGVNSYRQLGVNWEPTKFSLLTDIEHSVAGRNRYLQVTYYNLFSEDIEVVTYHITAPNISSTVELLMDLPDDFRDIPNVSLKLPEKEVKEYLLGMCKIDALYNKCTVDTTSDKYYRLRRSIANAVVEWEVLKQITQTSFSFTVNNKGK